MANPPLHDLAYNLIGMNNYEVLFPPGSPAPTEQQLVDAVKQVLRTDCPAIAGRVRSGGNRKNKRSRKTRMKMRRKTRRN
jgi:hypothetical protein